MNTQTRVIVGVLGVLVVALAATLGAVIAMDDDDMMARRGRMGGDDGYAGMMRSMGGMDSDAMLSHMREVLGADDFQRMMEHVGDHGNGGTMTGDPNVDQMMHRMMDGMMQHMPADRDNIMPPGRDEHHRTPAASNTPQP